MDTRKTAYNFHNFIEKDKNVLALIKELDNNNIGKTLTVINLSRNDFDKLISTIRTLPNVTTTKKVFEMKPFDEIENCKKLTFIGYTIKHEKSLVGYTAYNEKTGWLMIRLFNSGNFQLFPNSFSENLQPFSTSYGFLGNCCSYFIPENPEDYFITFQREIIKAVSHETDFYSFKNYPELNSILLSTNNSGYHKNKIFTFPSIGDIMPLIVNKQKYFKNTEGCLELVNQVTTSEGVLINYDSNMDKKTIRGYYQQCSQGIFTFTLKENKV